jgi:hypothetical protein
MIHTGKAADVQIRFLVEQKLRAVGKSSGGANNIKA